MTDATAVAQAAVDALSASARAAKKTEAASRRQARENRQAIARIQEACRELGIELVTDTAPERHSHEPGTA